MNKDQALQWIENQEGLTITIGKNKTVKLTFAHLYEITGNDLPDAVAKLQDAVRVKREMKSQGGCNDE